MYRSNHSRFKDVLLALGAVTHLNLALQRIQLQKFIYLLDIFSSTWSEVSKPPRFQPYNHGPYDKNIQNAVDALAFRGLVEVTNINFQGTNKVQASYRLSNAGRIFLPGMILHPVLLEEYQLALEVADEVQRRGWDQIVKIVYAEPTYFSARTSEDRRVLATNEPTSNQTTYLAGLFRDAWATTSESPPTRLAFVQTMFLVFDQFRLSPAQELQTPQISDLADPF